MQTTLIGAAARSHAIPSYVSPGPGEWRRDEDETALWKAFAERPHFGFERARPLPSNSRCRVGSCPEPGAITFTHRYTNKNGEPAERRVLACLDHYNASRRPKAGSVSTKEVRPKSRGAFTLDAAAAAALRERLSLSK